MFSSRMVLSPNPHTRNVFHQHVSADDDAGSGGYIASCLRFYDS